MPTSSSTLNTVASHAIKQRILNRARELKFDACRFTTAAPPNSSHQLTKWLAQGKHGQMSYMARNAEKRLDPQKVLPGAKSIITLATSYDITDTNEQRLNQQKYATRNRQ